MNTTIMCPRCRETMVKGLSRGTFAGWRNDGMTGTTQTVKYMCTGCGYIEERAVNSKYLKKTQ
jgi:RNase P subunit RPR2